jgi:hypothetical protein
MLHFHGFGRWHGDAPRFEAKLDELPVQTEIEVNGGSADLCKGFRQGQTSSHVNHYFGESRLRVDTYPGIIVSGVIESLSFAVWYGMARLHGFHFKCPRTQTMGKMKKMMITL